MNRRNFLRNSAAFSIPALLSAGVAANPAALFSQFANNDDDRILVLIRLSGGNDGLNTVIGLDQLSNLRTARPNLALRANQTLRLNTTTALHPSMSGFRNLFDDGKLGIIQGAGYPNHNRSHFRSTDIWQSASSASQMLRTGWMGRYLNEDFPGYPEGFPNDQSPHPLAMTMGNVVSETCQGLSGNYSVAVRDPFNYVYIAPGGDTPLPDNRFGNETDFVRTLIGQSNEYGEVVETAANAGNNIADYPDGQLSDQLRNVARLISGGLETKIYVATLGGFDTHSTQVTGDRTVGRHADLLAQLSGAIAAFQEDLLQLGHAHRVLGLTYSEFGRRIRSNQSGGTDHGSAAPMFVFGDCVSVGILGNSPNIDRNVGPNEGVAMQNDFRDIYGSVLIDWFDVPEATVQNLISGGFTYLPIATGCASTNSNAASVEASVYSADNHLDVSWAAPEESLDTRYIVERSTDGQSFKPVAQERTAKLGGAGTFIDKNVEQGVTYYYRVKQSGRGGATSTSSIQIGALRGTHRKEWSVGLPRPNPLSEQSIVQVYAPESTETNYRLVDIGGRVIRSGQVYLTGGSDNRIPISAAGLRSGAYFWQIATGKGETVSRKVMVR